MYHFLLVTAELNAKNAVGIPLDRQTKLILKDSLMTSASNLRRTKTVCAVGWQVGIILSLPGICLFQISTENRLRWLVSQVVFFFIKSLRLEGLGFPDVYIYLLNILA